MLIKLNVLWTFLKTIGVPMLVLTLASIYAVIQFKAFGPLPLFFFIKILADAVIFYLWYSMRGHQLYYYYNLGIRKRLLFSFALGVDLLSFIGIHLMLMLWL